jgi:hypothetical protein
MFGTFFKSSLKAMIPIVLLPLFTCVLYITVIDKYDTFLIEKYEGEKSDETYEVGEFEVTTFYYWNSKAFQAISTCMIIAAIVNFILLMIIPCALGGAHPGKKKAQFYFGFFINIAICLGIPIYLFAFSPFMVSAGKSLILFALFFAGSLLPYILGALFVAPAYKKAFWFINRG